MTPDKPNRDALITAYRDAVLDTGGMAGTGGGESRTKSALVAYIDGLEERNKRCVCVYCGNVTILEDWSSDTIRATMAQHISTCEQHPLKLAAVEMVRLEAENAQLRAAIANAVHSDGDICNFRINESISKAKYCTPDNCIWTRVNQERSNVSND